MTKTSDDHALEVLLTIHDEQQSEVSKDLLRRCYELQKKFQYERDRDKPLVMMQKLVETEVAKELETEDDSQGAAK